MRNAASTSAHTPGPWHAVKSECKEVYGLDEHDAVLADNGRGMVADVCPVGSESLANARLIAAAPELLEAAKSICVWFECLMETPEWNGDKDDYLKLKKAIAKAEGRTYESSPNVP